MDEHVTYLQQVCRIGGRKFKKSTRYPVAKYKEELESVFSIKIEEDDPEIHPPYICTPCQRALKRASEKKATYCGGGCSRGTKATWSPHRRAGCSFCESYTTKSVGKPLSLPPTDLRGVAIAGAAHSTPAHTDTNTVTQESGTDTVTQESGMDVPAEEVYAHATSKHQATLAIM